MLSRKRIAAFVLIVLLITNGVILAQYARGVPSPNPVSAVILTLAGPAHDGLSRAGRGLRGAWDRYVALSGVEKENERLKKELDRLRLALSRTSELEQENARLAAALGLARKAPFSVAAARVVAGDPSGAARSLVIDRGSSGGARVGMAVITPAGLVGRIAQVAPYYSRVLLITNPSSALDVRVARTRARGILCGDPSGACRMKYVLKSEDMLPGDAVVTSGMDRLFAPGLDVGTVGAVSRGEEGMFASVTVVPRVSFKKLEEVLVIVRQESVPPGDQR